ncbi:hypothetical protein PZB74_08795 [Porifericola rhodea]|uniref:hypothetical protein n=1 Tax=Porifericola rhodea TaxID=930972 RepID=UPI00266712C7|nr:hypothetical protein [Porifericola rhodea]WKN33429.1 hypothetical protein PZB74_08795 [Porifericola rhodea]
MVNLDVTSRATYSSSPKAHFEELQKVRQTWIWMILSMGFAGLVLMGAHQIVFKQAFGENLLTFSSIVFVAILLALLTVFVYQSHLITKIDDKGIHYRFFPLHLQYRSIQWSEIEEVRIREYDALSEYGGWGIKFGSHGNAYTVKGRYGLQLELTNDRKILLGTQRPIELERLILQLLYDYEVH